MKSVFISAALSLSALAVATPSLAALNPGDKAPDFTVKAATNGKVNNFTLSQALKKGPVVVYFYPKAFTKGCSVQAQQFSDNIDAFKSKKVTVIGLSADPIATLSDFSTKDCAGKFAVGSDPKAKIAKSYDAKLPAVDMSGRVSYLIGQDGRILYTHDSSNAVTHVPGLLEAMKTLK
ncbi:MAG: peroxiredoxin [Asticcacaulis sp.]